MSSEMICKRLVKIEKNKNIFKRMIKRKIASQQNQDNFQHKTVSNPPPPLVCVLVVPDGGYYGLLWLKKQ